MTPGAVAAFGACALALSLSAASPDAVLLLDRGPNGSAGRPVGWNATGGVFVTDHFVIGRPGESWVIEKVRTWGAPDSNPAGAALGDLFERIALYGGLESDSAPASAEEAAAICACHGPVSLASIKLPRGANAAENAQVALKPAGNAPQLWEIEFRNLRWTLPGGRNAQFGVFGQGRALTGRERPLAWFCQASPTGGKHAFRLFETGGKPVVAPAGSLPQDESLGVNIQVWGHLLVDVGIETAGKTMKVVLAGSPTFDVSAVDVGSLRFGPNGAAPRRHEAGKSGSLMLWFGVEESGVQAAGPVACLTGRLSSGIPFEGCGLLPVTGGKRL